METEKNIKVESDWLSQVFVIYLSGDTVVSPQC